MFMFALLSSMQTTNKKARKIFEQGSGTLRTIEALRAGIHPRTLYALRDSGEIERVARGLFRLSTLPPPSEPDLMTVAKKVPHAVFCLVTAMAFHRLTTQVPHAVEIALARTSRTPRLAHPPIRVFRFSPASLRAGIETHAVDGVPIQIYSREKTLADVFKYRHKLGQDVALEALRTYRSQPKQDYQKVLEYARTCRVENIMRPYLETVM
jgi:predicted transcriptional regulator of viral defense system